MNNFLVLRGWRGIFGNALTSSERPDKHLRRATTHHGKGCGFRAQRTDTKDEFSRVVGSESQSRGASRSGWPPEFLHLFARVVHLRIVFIAIKKTTRLRVSSDRDWLPALVRSAAFHRGGAICGREEGLCRSPSPSARRRLWRSARAD
jgi:hypothetical protein